MTGLDHDLDQVVGRHVLELLTVDYAVVVVIIVIDDEQQWPRRVDRTSIALQLRARDPNPSRKYQNCEDRGRRSSSLSATNPKLGFAGG